MEGQAGLAGIFLTLMCSMHYMPIVHLVIACSKFLNSNPETGGGSTQKESLVPEAPGWYQDRGCPEKH